MKAVSCFYFDIENPVYSTPFGTYVKNIIDNTLYKGVVCKLHLLRHLICFMKKLSFR